VDQGSRTGLDRFVLSPDGSFSQMFVQTMLQLRRT
jgi:hypothetical protein